MMSDEERRRLGVKPALDFDGGTDFVFGIVGRAASKGSGHTHSVAVSLKDGNAQDVFAVKISQDTTYGTPIFTTMGGFSSCPECDGRDSFKDLEIKLLCVCLEEDGMGEPLRSVALCSSMLSCEREDLEPGQDAIFSVQLREPDRLGNRGAGNGAPRAERRLDMLGIREVRSATSDDPRRCVRRATWARSRSRPVSLGNKNLRDGNGMVINGPLNYGWEFEKPHAVSAAATGAQISASRTRRSSSRSSRCARTGLGRSNQEVYQYQKATMAQIERRLDRGGQGGIQTRPPTFIGRVEGQRPRPREQMEGPSATIPEKGRLLVTLRYYTT